MILLAVLTTLSISALGAPYPNAIVDRTPGKNFCSSRYRISTTDSLERVASFYRQQAAAAHVPVVGDTAAKFAAYRMLVFARKPKFLDVVISRKDARTTATVSFHIDSKGGC